MAETKQSEQVAYISVAGEEVEKVLPAIAKASGWTIPYPQWASVEIAIIGERVVGFAPLYLVPHSDGLWIAENYRGTDIAQKLADRIQKIAIASNMKQMICMTNNEFVKRLCRSRGMVEKGTYTVFVKE
jgi:hypothetical protein